MILLPSRPPLKQQHITTVDYYNTIIMAHIACSTVVDIILIVKGESTSSAAQIIKAPNIHCTDRICIISCREGSHKMNEVHNKLINLGGRTL